MYVLAALLVRLESLILIHSGSVFKLLERILTYKKRLLYKLQLVKICLPFPLCLAIFCITVLCYCFVLPLFLLYGSALPIFCFTNLCYRYFALPFCVIDILLNRAMLPIVCFTVLCYRYLALPLPCVTRVAVYIFYPYM